MPDHAIGTGSDRAKVKANIDAIRVLKAIQDEDRTATADEKAVLVRFVGWGAFAQTLFEAHPRSSNGLAWKTERDALADLLTAQEWSSARASTLNAHFTSEAVIKGIWQAVEHLGFEGGRVLEPAAGIGHFIGLTPDRLRDRIAWSGVELESVTAGIAQALYGDADIKACGFEKADWPDGFFDLAISNVPFGNYGVRDTTYRPMSIHDYFFVKALDKVRTGGLVAFVTSRYTLDKKTDFARREIAKRAEFLGAIRLPGGSKGAFAANAGTEVTADIVFLRRKADGAPSADQRWLDIVEITTPDGPAISNRYFAENPAMMLGEMRLESSQYAAQTPVLIGEVDSIDDRIASAAQAMPRNAVQARKGGTFQDPILPSSPREQDGTFLVVDGDVSRRHADGEDRISVSSTEKDKLIRLIGLRDTVNDLMSAQSRGIDANDLRAALNVAYDGFVSRYGPINKTIVSVSQRTRADGTPVILRRQPNFAPFADDPDAFKVAALEDYSDVTGQATKAAIFTHDILQARAAPTITGPLDALALSLDARGVVDLALIAQSLKVSEGEAIKALGSRVWLDPNGDVSRTAEDYLSGDVVQKLDDAKLATALDDKYGRNVAALEAVQPAPLTRVDIRVLCGAPWVPVDIYRDFLSQKLGIKAEGLTLNAITKKWQFLKKPEVPLSSVAEYSSPRSTVPEIVVAALNNAEIRVMDTNADGAAIYNAAASEESNAKVAAVRELFSGAPESGIDGWVFADDDRAVKLEAIYNRAFNRLVPTVYDGTHLTMPSIARYIARGADREIIPFALRPHQLNAVWRIVASGNTLLDHAVGAGKTFTMIAAGMEQKRLGLIRRPMYVVPNHMLEQFSSEFRLAYPAADVLVADKDAMSAKRRKEFAARAATGNWDGIVITHDAFGRIPMSAEATEAFIRDEIEDLRDFATRAVADEGKSSVTVKELEKAAKRLDVKLAALLNQERKDAGLTFEELGVDFLFIDEAHAFKNLSFQTRHSRVKGINSGTEAQRASDLLLKLRYLEERRPGRSAVFATGTPVSNTIAEMYTMQRYLQPHLLQDYGIHAFDAWAGTFGDIVSQVELGPSGHGFRTTRSFSKFVNIPELISLYSRVADTQTAEMLNLPRPKLQNGAVTVVETTMSPRETSIMETLVIRAERIKGQRSEKGGDNILKILGEGLQLATDIRLLDAEADPNPHGKIAKAAQNIAAIWKSGQEPGLCQIVFLDMGVPGRQAKPGQSFEAADVDIQMLSSTLKVNDSEASSSGDSESNDDKSSRIIAARFDLYSDLRSRLVNEGIPRTDIAFIHEADSDLKKARLFADVRKGTVRVLIGSTGKMGVGMNVQTRLIAMHHLDAPWRPADVEQRDGRILRQGNLNGEVAIYRYITLKSLDAYRWQTLNTKANFIAQLRAGARGVRTAEDIDSPLPEAAMIKAAATGDPRIMEHAELSKELRELEAGRRAHERGLTAARFAYDRTHKTIAALKEDIGCAKVDADRILDLSGDNFTITITAGTAPRVYTERRDAGEAIKAQLLAKGTRLWEQAADVVLGQLSGFEITARVKKAAGQMTYSLNAKGEAEYARDEAFQLSEDTDATGLVRRLEGLLRGIPKLLAEREGELAKAAADLPRIERQLGSVTFGKQERFLAVKQRVRDLEMALQPEQKTASPINENLLGESRASDDAVTLTKSRVNISSATRTQTANSIAALGDESAIVLAARNELAQKAARGRGR